MWGGLLCICVHKMLHICAGVTRGQKRKSESLGTRVGPLEELYVETEAVVFN